MEQKNHLYFLKHQPVSLIGNGYFRGKIRRLAIRMLNQSGGGVEIKTALDYSLDEHKENDPGLLTHQDEMKEGTRTIPIFCLEIWPGWSSLGDGGKRRI